MSSTAISDLRARRFLSFNRLLFALGEWRSRPLISVVIATFNRGQLLTERTIPSILQQTYGHFEIVVVGDGCTDDTGERLHRLNDSRIRWENLPKRGVYPEDPFYRWLVAGTPPANRALDLARGRWIAWCDDDDTWTDNHLIALLDHASQTDAELAYAAAMFQRSAEEWLRVGGVPPIPGHVPHSTVLYRSYLKAFRYDIESWKEGMAGDAHRWQRMLKAGVRFSYLDRVLCHSPLRPGDVLRGQKAAEEARRIWNDERERLNAERRTQNEE